MKNNFFDKINMFLVNIVYSSVIFVIFSYYFLTNSNYLMFAFIAVFFMIFITANITVHIVKKKHYEERIRNISFSSRDKDFFAGDSTVYNFGLPLVFINDSGHFIWCNEQFDELFDNKSLMKQELKDMFKLHIAPKIELLAEDFSFEQNINGKEFLVKTVVVAHKAGKREGYSVMIYFIDKSNEKHIQKLYDSRRIAVGEIVVDSYEEIYQTNGEIVINSINVELSKIIDRWLRGKKAVARKMVRDRYFVVIEYDSLQEIIKDKFSILSDVKKINVGNSIPVTLSIGISALWDSVSENEANIAKAIESVTSRGGDQALVMIKGKKDEYYGAGNVEFESLNEVKARVVANQLKDIILDSSKVIIMGHAIPETDMDSLGACLAVYRAATLLGKRARIVLKEDKEMIKVMLDDIKLTKEYDDVFITTSYALAIKDEKTLIVVVDVSDAPRTEAPRLLDGAERVVVIDHHRRGPSYIRNTLLDYNEVTASSTSELMVEILQYMHPGLCVPKIEAEAMYAGILVDTKNLVFKTGRRTFAAAAFLRGQNVDTVTVRKYTQPDLDTFRHIANVTKNAKIFENRIAISRASEQLVNSDLVISIAADQMLNVLGIEASFVLYKFDDGSVKITARSLGEINVQVIMSRLGGGGHLTAAATVIKNAASLDSVEKSLTDQIKAYLDN